MGLDMYIYRIKPAMLDPNIVYKYEELWSNGYSVYEDVHIDSPLLRDIKKVAKPYQVEAEYYDLDKMQKHYSSKEKPYWCGIAGGEQIFNIDGNLVYLNQKELKKFLLISVDTFWVVQKHQVAYWRAREDIQSAIYKYIGKRVENEGYYKITPKVIDRISELNIPGFNMEYEYNKDDLYYHEWY